MLESASSVKECKENKSPGLDLSSYEFDAIPEELRAKSLEAHLRVLNLSSNPLRQLEPRDHYLPTSLRELHLSGCCLSSLPESLTRLIQLQRFFAGANLLSNVDVLFKLPSLQHAGLSYNLIQDLPQTLLPKCSSLLSLDISHNSMESLDQTFACVQALPSLQILNLQGNPLCLLPHYCQRLQEELASRLVILNGQKPDAAFASRPQGAPSQSSKSQSMHSRHTATPGTAPLEVSRSFRHSDRGGLGDGVRDGTNMSIELKNLSLKIPDPFAPLHKLWADELAAAQAAGQPVVYTVLPPPQPCMYHFELHSCEEDAAPVHGSDGRWQGQQHSSLGSALPLDSDIQGASCRDQGQGSQAAGMESYPQPPASPFSLNLVGGPEQEACRARAVGGTEAGAQAGFEETAVASMQGVHASAPSCVPELQKRNSSSLPSSTTVLASIPLILHPPEAPASDLDTSGKGKGAAAKNKPPVPKPPPKPGKGKVDGPEETPKLERGYLQAVLPLRANLGSRNWLRSGIRVKLFSNQLEAVMKPEALLQQLQAQQEPPPPPKGKGKGGRPSSSEKNKDRPRSGRKDKDAQEPPAVDMSKYDILLHTKLLGMGTIRAGSSLLKGNSNTVHETVAFIPEPALWDPQGLRMALEDPRHSTEPVAVVEATLSLHVPSPPLPTLPIATPPEKTGRKSPLAGAGRTK